MQRFGTCGAEPNFSDYTVDVGERDADGKWLKPQHVYLFKQDGGPTLQEFNPISI